MSRRLGMLGISVACALLLLPTAGAAQEVAGAWAMTINLPMGGGRTVNGTLTLQVDGTSLSGTWQAEGSEQTQEVTGTIEGSAVNFSWTGGLGGRRGGGRRGGGGGRRGGGRGGLTLAFTGTVADETMSGTVALGDFGEGEWSAKRPE